MCQSQADGGKRCAAHTRPRFEAAERGSAEWDGAASDYGRTKQGREALTAEVLAAVGAQDWEYAAACQSALEAGKRADEAQAEFNQRAARVLATALETTDVDRMRALVASGNASMKCHVASNRNLPEDLAVELATSGPVGARRELAYRTDLPDSVYEVLIADRNDSVQETLQQWTSPRPGFVIRHWAAHENLDVRRSAVSGAGYASEGDFVEMLDGLADDESYLVRLDVARCNKTSPETLRRMLTRDASSRHELKPVVELLKNSRLSEADVEAGLRKHAAALHERDDETGYDWFAVDRQDLMGSLERRGLGRLVPLLIRDGEAVA